MMPTCDRSMVFILIAALIKFYGVLPQNASLAWFYSGNRRHSLDVNKSPATDNFLRRSDAIFASNGVNTRKYKRRDESNRIKRSENETKSNYILIRDPEWKEQWYMSEQNDHRKRWPSLNVAEAWQLATGRHVTVAIVSDGILRNHPDLTNLDTSISLDFSRGPTRQATNKMNVATELAGIIAAADNTYCGIGVAFKSRIIDIKMSKGVVPVAMVSRALLSNLHYTDIYLNSWEYRTTPTSALQPIPQDIQDVIHTAAKHGRKGKGAIYIWDIGNNWNGRSCVYDPYINNIHTVVISGVTNKGKQLRDSTSCSAILASAYTSDADTARGIVTTTEGGCTSNYSGGSVPAALASGIVALALEANPRLTWRDIQHLIIQSSNPNLKWEPNDFKVNGAAFRVSNTFGFGLMDAAKMVSLAKIWQTVNDKITCLLTYTEENRYTIKHKLKFHFEIYSSPTNCMISYLEHVEVTLHLVYPKEFRSRQFTLESPSGTKSFIIPKNDSVPNLNWTVLTVQFWGEEPTGSWKLNTNGFKQKQQKLSDGVFMLFWSLKLHGLTHPVSVPYEIPILQSRVISIEKDDFADGFQVWVYVVASIAGVTVIIVLLVWVWVKWISKRSVLEETMHYFARRDSSEVSLSLRGMRRSSTQITTA